MEKHKDDIALAVSILAFALSLFATVLGELRADDDKQRTVRSQLTEVLRGLMSVQMEHAKLMHESKDDAMYQTTGSAALGQQNGFLLDQAFYLADQVPHLVTTYEYNTMAVAGANAGNVLAAEKYYRKAVEVAYSPLYRSQAIRAYAMFLFAQHRFMEAREQFALALRQPLGRDNLSRQNDAVTYQSWAWNEQHLARSEQRARELYRKASDEISGIDVEFLRSAMQQRLNWLQENRSWAPAFPILNSDAATPAISSAPR
ncbi:hypothetical protein E7V67_021190 [[Empedobacter] haloabium]|uniref:Tetratricopeptide repeat protein n=1 Tax=[Empedobacter] haloabium TaxID=592317 RepID=A0ABZ1UJA1_9BURK